MINLCRNCGEPVETAEFMDGERLIHSGSTLAYCDDRKILGRELNKAELMTVESQEDWYRYIIEGVVMPLPKGVVEEPSYMMFARANVKQGQDSSPIVVKSLLERIDRLEAEKKGSR